MPGSNAVWTLAYPGTSVVLGPRASGIMHAEAPDVGDIPWRTDDTDRPREDGRGFGTDYVGGRTITFTLHVLGQDEAQTRDREAALAAAWRADRIRSTPGAVALLHTVNAGRERVVYGRPRRFAPAGKHTWLGAGRVVCDFACTDMSWYGPVLHEHAVSLVPPPSGGLLAPLSGPLTTIAPASRADVIQVGGDLPAWPRITFAGPVTNPACVVTGLWTLALGMTIPAGQAVTVDTRPWARTVLRSDGASFAGALTRVSPRLSRTGVPPGRWEIALRGVDVSGTAQMRFAWQDTHSSL